MGYIHTLNSQKPIALLYVFNLLCHRQVCPHSVDHLWTLSNKSNNFVCQTATQTEIITLVGPTFILGSVICVSCRSYDEGAAVVETLCGCLGCVDDIFTVGFAAKFGLLLSTIVLVCAVCMEPTGNTNAT